MFLKGNAYTLPRTEIFVGPYKVDQSTPPNPINGYTPWRVPKNASFVYVLCVGGGSGGGAGASGGTGTSRTGGASGSRGAAAKMIIPAFLLPRVIYVQPGWGGSGGALTFQGSDTLSSHITDTPSPTNQANIIIQSGALSSNASAIGGQAGTTVAANGQQAEPIATNLLQPMGGLAIWAAFGDVTDTGSNSSIGAVGQSGTFGGAATKGLVMTEGGAGGSVSVGNVAFAGGGVTGAGKVQSIVGGVAGGATGGDGGPGLNSFWPMVFTGGAGGGGGTTQGGAGGQGGYGCGGGGGGGGTTGGVGGPGGPGFIIIVCW